MFEVKNVRRLPAPPLLRTKHPEIRPDVEPTPSKWDTHTSVHHPRDPRTTLIMDSISKGVCSSVATHCKTLRDKSVSATFLLPHRERSIFYEQNVWKHLIGFRCSTLCLEPESTACPSTFPTATAVSWQRPQPWIVKSSVCWPRHYYFRFRFGAHQRILLSAQPSYTDLDLVRSCFETS